MKLVVVTDIFGLTPALIIWLTAIVDAIKLKTAIEIDVEIISPYLESPVALRTYSTAQHPISQHMSSDEDAYVQFITRGGLEHYLQKVQQSFALQKQTYVALGFSVGATTLWQLASTSQPWLQQALCFYGGQIRYHWHLTPQVPIQLIWAQESHFDVTALHQQLQDCQQVTSVVTSYRHGFLNPHSSGFDAAAASHYQNLISQMLISQALSLVNNSYLPVTQNLM